jgi:hypothetical protein
MWNSLNKKSERDIPMQSGKAITTKNPIDLLRVSLRTLTTERFVVRVAGLAFIFMMFCISFTDAQCFCNCGSHPRPNSYCFMGSNGSYRCKTNGHGLCEGRIGNTASIPDQSSLEDIYPNPVSASSTVSFYVGQKGQVSIKILDLSGRLVTTLADESFEEGDYEVTWNAADVKAGIYFLRFETMPTGRQAVGYSENRKLFVTK